jgi:hypothetical protein
MYNLRSGEGSVSFSGHLGHLRQILLPLRGLSRRPLHWHPFCFANPSFVINSLKPLSFPARSSMHVVLFSSATSSSYASLPLEPRPHAANPWPGPEPPALGRPSRVRTSACMSRASRRPYGLWQRCPAGWSGSASCAACGRAPLARPLELLAPSRVRTAAAVSHRPCTWPTTEPEIFFRWGEF